MNYLPRFLLFLVLDIVNVSAYAQDKIYKTDGNILESKVKAVGTNTIIFKRFTNQDGPEYTILKKEVSKIIYENGTTDIFSKADEPQPGKKGKGNMKKKYGDNFISVTPGAYTVALDGTMNDVGVGVTYERLVDKKGHIGVNIPVLMCFSSNKDFNNYHYYYNSNYYTYTGSYHSFFFEPGIKLYPANSNTAVRYSFGASFFCSLGTEPQGVYSYNNNYGGGTPSTATYHYTIFGLMLSNSVNITAGKHMYLALDMAAGIPISDNRHSNNDYGLEFLLGPFVQFGFKVGARY